MNWNKHVNAQRPTIYADMNIYRYLACGDISITDPERFIWVYSQSHFNEIFRNRDENGNINTDALKGMTMLKAVGMWYVGSPQTDNFALQSYTDPFIQYRKHEEKALGYKDTYDYEYDIMSYLFGADNYEVLKRTIEKMHKDITRLSKAHEKPARSKSAADHKAKESLITKERAILKEKEEEIESTRRYRRQVDKIKNRKLLGNDDIKKIEEVHSPVDALLEFLYPTNTDTNKDQFLRIISDDDSKPIKVAQGWAIYYLYGFLNAKGIFPDKELAKPGKIKNSISDHEHTEMASYCDALISADKRLCSKARSVYTFMENTTEVLHFKYKKPTLNIEIKSGRALELISNYQ